MVTLDVYDGARRRAVDIDADLVRIGRDHDCELVLPADTTVSRRHAVLRSEDGAWVVEDLGSRNGTYVNGERLASPARLGAADRLLIGNYVVVIRGGRSDETDTIAAEEGETARAAIETGLSRRELEVLRLVCAGRSDRQIADALFISVKTVHSHLERIRDKTGARRRPELVRYGMSHGLA